MIFPPNVANVSTGSNNTNGLEGKIQKYVCTDFEHAVVRCSGLILLTVKALTL